MNPLEKLKDIHLPEPIIWWYPDAIGWYILFTFLGLILIYILWNFIQHRHIKKQIQALLQLPKEQRPLQIMMTLKATAIKNAPEEANRLQGKPWTHWLQQQNIKLTPEWQAWLSQGYLTNQPPPKDWYKKLSRWLKKLH